MQNELEDDLPIRGKRLLSDIYQRCNVAIYEPASCEEALKDPKWKIAMEEEMSMIHNNQRLEQKVCMPRFLCFYLCKFLIIFTHNRLQQSKDQHIFCKLAAQVKMDKHKVFAI